MHPATDRQKSYARYLEISFDEGIDADSLGAMISARLDEVAPLPPATVRQLGPGITMTIQDERKMPVMADEAIVQANVRLLIELARRRRMASIVHQRPTEAPVRRTIEPHQLTRPRGETTVILLGWQTDPPAHGRAWRRLRVDLMTEVGDGGSDFTPKAEVTMEDGRILDHGEDYEPKSLPESLVAYRSIIGAATGMKRMTDADLGVVRAAALLVSDDEIRAVHAELFARAIFDRTTTGAIGWQASDELASLRKRLKKLGWVPGDKGDVNAIE